MKSKITTISGVFLALTVFTVAVAMFFRNPLLVYTAVFLVVTNLTLFVWSQYSVRGVKVVREKVPLALANHPVEIEVSLINTRRNTRFGTLGLDLHRGLTSGQDFTPVAFFEAPPGQPVPGSYNVVPARRGVFELGPFFLYGGDPFGFYKCWKKVDQPGKLTVLPDPVEFTYTHTHSASHLSQDELETVAQPGESTEFLGVREYQQGEPLKRVHWPTSARLGTLVSRQYELNVAPSISALLIADRDMLRGTKINNPLEYSITMIASLANATCRERFHFNFLSLQGSEHEYARGTGPRFSRELAVQLAGLEGVGEVDWEQHSRLIVSLLPESSDLVMFTSQYNDALQERCRQLAMHFRSLSVISFNLRSFDLGNRQEPTGANMQIGDGYLVHEVACATNLRYTLENVLADAKVLGGRG